MQGARQVKDGIFRRKAADVGKVLAFQGAFRAIAHRADISAPVALDAFREFAKPDVETLVQVQRFESRDGTELTAFSWFAGNKIFGKRLQAFAGIGQFLRTGKAHGDDLFRIELVGGKKGLQPAVVTASDKYSEGIIGITASDRNQLFVERITGVAGSFQISGNQSIQVVGIRKKIWSDMTMQFPKAEKTFDPAGRQEFLNSILDLVIH